MTFWDTAAPVPRSHSKCTIDRAVPFQKLNNRTVVSKARTYWSRLPGTPEARSPRGLPLLPETRRLPHRPSSNLPELHQARKAGGEKMGRVRKRDKQRGKARGCTRIRVIGYYRITAPSTIANASLAASLGQGSDQRK